MIRNQSRLKRRLLQTEALENRRVLAAYISELHFSPLFGDNDQHQYLEIRGEPGTTAEAGTYFLGIESADGVGELGDIHTIFDISGLSFGTNGYLAFLQSVKDPGGVGAPPPGYSVVPGSNVFQGTDGFLGLPGGIYQADGDSKSIHAGTSTYFLVQSDVKPTLIDDIDANDDGIPDGPFENWQVLDGFTTVPWVEGPFNQRAFAQIVFSERGAGDGVLPGATVIRTQQQSYAGRIGGSTGYEPHEWLTGNTTEEGTDTFQFQFEHGTFGTPRPEAYGGRFLDHIGGPNWFGSFSGSVFIDGNQNGVQDEGELPADGVEIVVAHQNQDETFWETIEPDLYEIDTDISNVSKYVTTVTAGGDNIHLGFKNLVAQEPFGNVGDHVFSHAGVNFFNSSGRRLRMDFYRPVRTVMIDVIGNSDLDEVYGRLEIFNEAGDSLGFVRSSALRESERQTISISSPNDDIAWALAYSDEDYLDSSPFGRLDTLKIEIPYVTESIVADGQYSVAPLYDDTYIISMKDDGAFYQVTPEAPNSSYLRGVTEASHTNGINFGVLPKTSANLVDQAVSVGEHIAADGVIANLPIDLAYPGQLLEIEILSGDADDQFAIDSSTFELKSAKGDFDFESQAAYSLVVQLTDTSQSNLQDQATIQVTIEDENDAPQVIDTQVQLEENSAVDTQVGTVTATDQDSSNFTWSIIGGNPGDAFAIDPQTGTVRVAKSEPINFEVQPVFDLLVRATDDGNPNRSGEGTLRVQLLDIDEVPIVADIAMQVAENSPAFTHVGFLDVEEPDAGQAISWRIVGQDAQFFDLVPATGQLRVASNADFDFESKSEYVILAEATDDGVPPKTGSTSITITIQDRNDPPEVPVQSPSIEENSPDGAVVGDVEATDQDADQTLTYEITGGVDADKFVINNLTGELSLASGVSLDFETKSSMEVAVAATDSADPPLTTSRVLTVSITDANDAPEITSSSLFLSEDVAAGTPVQVTFEDQDAADTHTFSIVSQTQPWLSVDSSGSGLQVAEGAQIDFEGDNQMTMVLTIEDQAGAQSTATITVSATDANDAPVVSNPIPDQEIDIDVPFDFQVPEGTFEDQDSGDLLTYSATSGDGFSLPDWISFNAATQRFTGTPTSTDVGVLEVRVNAVDSSSEIAFDIFSIDVLPAAKWHNAAEPEDVSGDGFVVARDALLVINFINTTGSTEVPAGEEPTQGFLDVTGDNFVTPIDALFVINRLNTRGGGEGEAFASFDSSGFQAEFLEEDDEENWIEMLALDQMHP